MDNGLDYQTNLSPALKHVTFLSVGFFIFSILNMFKVYEKPDQAFLMHHIIVGFGVPIWFFGNCPAIYSFLLVVQITGVSYHSYVLCRQTEGVDPFWTSFFFEMNFYFWILFRFVAYGILLTFCAHYESKYAMFTITEQVVSATFLSVVFCFHIFWLLKAIEAKQRKKSSKVILASN